MTQQLSTELVGFNLTLKNGKEYKLDNASGEKLEIILAKAELPKFIRIKADGSIATISVSMVAELTRDIKIVKYTADF
jgi:hypothetical protein